MKYFLTELAIFAIATQFHNAAGIAVAGSKVLARDDTLDSTSSTTALSSSESATGTNTPKLNAFLEPLLGGVFNASHHMNMTADTASPTGTASAEDPYKDKDSPNDAPSSNSTNNGLSGCDNCMCLNRNFYEMRQNQDGQNHNQDDQNQNQNQNQNQDGQNKELSFRDVNAQIENRMVLHGCGNICDYNVVEEAQNGKYDFDSHCANYVNPYARNGLSMKTTVG